MIPASLHPDSAIFYYNDRNPYFVFSTRGTEEKDRGYEEVPKEETWRRRVVSIIEQEIRILCATGVKKKATTICWV